MLVWSGMDVLGAGVCFLCVVKLIVDASIRPAMSHLAAPVGLVGGEIVGLV
jgi:hypothetical protein